MCDFAPVFPNWGCGVGQQNQHNRDYNVYVWGYDGMHGVTHEVAGQLGGGDGHIATKDQVVQAASTGQAKHGKVALQEGIKGEDNPDGKNGDW